MTPPSRDAAIAAAGHRALRIKLETLYGAGVVRPDLAAHVFYGTTPPRRPLPWWLRVVVWLKIGRAGGGR